MEKGAVTLVDTIAYEQLVPGTTYTVEGALYDKATGEAFVGADGKAVTATATFTPEEPSGTCEVTFDVDASMLATETQLVAFEEVRTEEGDLVAEHKDLESEAQTVTVTVPHTPGQRDSKEPKPQALPGTGDVNDPMPIRLAAAAGSALAVISTVVSIRTSPHGKRAEMRRPHKRQKTRLHP